MPAIRNNMCSPQVKTSNCSSIANAIPLVGLPTDADIICGRGRGIWSHPGNLKFKYLIESNLHAYSQTVRRKEKSVIINHVLDTTILMGARFVKKEQNVWYAVDEKEAREKTAHAMRDFLKRRIQDFQQNKDNKRKRDLQAQPESLQPDWIGSERSKRSFSDPSPVLSRSIFEFNLASGIEANVSRSMSCSDLNSTFDLEPTPILESSTVNHQAPLQTPATRDREDERLQLFNSADSLHNLFEVHNSDEPVLDIQPSALDRPSENFNVPDFC